MKNKLKIPAIVLYFLGILLIGNGIPLMIQAGAGITVITSFPYALAVITQLFTVGMWVTIVQCIILLVAILILRRLTVSMMASFLTAYLLGLTIDVMSLAFENLAFQTLVVKILDVALASVVTGVGAGTLIYSAYPPVPDLVFIRDIGKNKNISLSKMKMLFDGIFFVLTLALTLLTVGHVIGIGWGTALSLLIIGVIVGQTEKFLTKTVERTHPFGAENEHRFFEFDLLSLFHRKIKKATD